MARKQYITLTDLEEADACTGQIDLFKELFGSRIKVTVELCLKHAKDFDWEWAGGNLLTSSEALLFYSHMVPINDADQAAFDARHKRYPNIAQDTNQYGAYCRSRNRYDRLYWYPQTAKLFADVFCGIITEKLT